LPKLARTFADCTYYKVKKKRFAAAILIIGLLGIACEVTKIVLYDEQISLEWCYSVNQWNYLAYFTVIINLLVDLWLITLSISILVKKKRLYEFLILPHVQGALVLYISSVCLVYCLFLFWFIGPFSESLWWANVMDLWSHLLLPAAMMGIWFIVPHTQVLRWRMLFFWLVLPIIYIILSEVRGLISDWYPYPFFRPSWVLFPVGIFITSACFIGIGSLIITFHNKKVVQNKPRLQKIKK